MVEKTNFIINLSAPYPSIHASYTNDLLKNLQKSEKQQQHYSKDLTIEKSIQLFQMLYRERFPQYHQTDFQHFLSLCLQLSATENCFTRTVLLNDEMLSTAVILKTENRLFLIMNATTPNGRSVASNHYLIDQVIQEFSEENFVFDFEGSEQKGIKAFYQSFHPINQPYFQVHINQLPAWVNWFKERFFNK
jgi:hypothetical protein